MPKITYLGHDPGSKNSGYGVIEINFTSVNKFSFKLLETGKIKTLLTDLISPPRETLIAHCKEINALIKKYGIKNFLAERYMNRGRNGKTGELVNHMLGAINVSLPKGVELIEIGASTWKNRANKIFEKNLDEMYEYAWQEFGIEPHEIDGVLQACWLAEKKLGIEVYKKFNTWLAQKKLIEQIKKCTTSELKKPKPRAKARTVKKSVSKKK